MIFKLFDLAMACPTLQIMLLTDGEVYNTRAVIDLVRKNAGNTRYV